MTNMFKKINLTISVLLFFPLTKEHLNRLKTIIEKLYYLKRNSPKVLHLKIDSHYCYILTLAPAQKCYSKVIHRKEVTHSNGQ